MTTGNIENWMGEIAQIGAIYPFPGTEIILVIIGAVFWLGWFVAQARMEGREYEEELNRVASEKAR